MTDTNTLPYATRDGKTLTYLEPLSETSEGFVLPENIRVNGVRLAVAS